MNENCNLIIAFLPEGSRAVEPALAERLLRAHPVRIDRIEDTPKGVLVFATSTRCESLELTRMREVLFQQGREAGCKVRLQRECLFKAMHSLTM